MITAFLLVFFSWNNSKLFCLMDAVRSFSFQFLINDIIYFIFSTFLHKHLRIAETWCRVWGGGRRKFREPKFLNDLFKENISYFTPKIYDDRFLVIDSFC